MPVARRRYDITPAEMLDLARSAVDAVVAELRGRADELLPSQVDLLEGVSRSLGDTVREIAQASHRAQLAEVRSQLEAVRTDVASGLAEHDARLVQAVEAHLSGYDPGRAGQLPSEVASAVLDGLDGSLPAIDKGLHELRELVGEVVERGKQSDLSRQRSLERLDDVLIELRASLTENVTRQHAVLIEMLDQKLSDSRLSEIASELPARIGAVISESVQRSHDLQAESLQDLATGLGRSIDAGLQRQRAVTAELSDTASKMADSVTGFSEVAEDAVTLAFERAQAAQAKRLSTMVEELREAQQEAAAELVTAAEGALAGKLEASYDALAAQLRMAAVEAEKRQQAQASAFAEAVAELRQAQAENKAELVQATESVTAQVGELMVSMPDRLSADISAVLQEARSRQDRIEALIAELAWVLGEHRAGSAGLRDDLARALEEIPEAIATLKDAALRSEARISDMVARKLAGPDAG